MPWQERAWLPAYGTLSYPCFFLPPLSPRTTLSFPLHSFYCLWSVLQNMDVACSFGAPWWRNASPFLCSGPPVLGWLEQNQGLVFTEQKIPVLWMVQPYRARRNSCKCSERISPFIQWRGLCVLCQQDGEHSLFSLAFRISIFIACLLPLGRREGEKTTFLHLKF